MIRYRSFGRAVARRGETSPLPGVRSRLWLVPYPGYAPPGVNPWTGAYHVGPGEARVEVGATIAAAWNEAIPGDATGPILVGPVPPRDDVYGAAAAAVAGARERRLSVVLIDAARADEGIAAGRDLVSVRLWRGGEATLWRRGSGVALPLIPGWTAEPGFLEELFHRAAEEGAPFVVPIEILTDGASRAAIHRDYAAAHPGHGDAFFERIHHGNLAEELAAARTRFEQAARAAGVMTRAPIPVAASDFEANVRARAALEEEADRRPEPDATRLRAAARRVEQLGRDLALVLREGNARLWFDRSSPAWPIIESIAAPTRDGAP